MFVDHITSVCGLCPKGFIMSTSTSSVSNAEVIRVYKEVQAAGGGWDEIATQLKMNKNAATGRVNGLKTQMGEALEAMVKEDGSPKFTVAQIDAFLLRSFPRIKKTGGGRKSDKSSVVDSLIAELGLDVVDVPEAPEAPETPAEDVDTTVEV